MKQIFTLMVLLFMNVGLFAQMNIEAEKADSVTVGSGYANEVYYSLTGGTVKTSSRIAWDLSFQTNNMGINILANIGAGVKLYSYPNGDKTAWGSIDTTGLSTWPMMVNSIKSWYGGAFVQNKTPSNIDFGWGKYDMSTHHIKGDSIFIIKTTADHYKKLMIVDRNPYSSVNTWTFKYANLDGTEEHEETINASDYSTVSHISYSLETNAIVENEAPIADWDFVFTKYFDYTIPYYVTGVLSNSDHISVQQVDGVTQATCMEFTETEFSDDIDMIGSDWKTFHMASFSYKLDTQRVYFVKKINEAGTDSSYWKLYFTGFEGMATGKYLFNKRNLVGTDGIDTKENTLFVQLYPNPAREKITLILDTPEPISYQIVDMNGRLVLDKKAENIGFIQEKINISDLKPGVYSLVVRTKNNIDSHNFIKQ